MAAVQFLNTLCRGLVGHVSYLSTCSLSTVYSEYLLYEPIARIAQSKGYKVSCEVPVPVRSASIGDHKRVDFVLDRPAGTIAVEVKWLGASRDVTNDVGKLRLFNCDERYLLVFGRGKSIDGLQLKENGNVLTRGGKVVRWDTGKTDYAARWFSVF